MAGRQRKVEELSIWEDARKMLRKARAEGIETVHDRLEKQLPQCSYCELGSTCRNCIMGPCRVDDSRPRGVCGADVDIIVARNFGRFIAGGSASHADHARDLVEILEAIALGKTEDYSIRNEPKMRALAEELGLSTADRSLKEVARDLAQSCYSDFGSRRGSVGFTARAPEKRQRLWAKLGITPRGIDREVVEMLHRTHMGVDNDALSTLMHAARTALADGWGGSMIGTELSDIIFGTPTPRESTANLGVIKEDNVNILVHGHNPVISEMVLAAARSKDMQEKAKSTGAKGITVGGLCCTGNEVLMRQGIPMCGNHLMTELTILTGAVEAVVADYQCIMPSMVHIASCYHTRFITTSDKARFTGAVHMGIKAGNAMAQSRRIVEMAIEAFAERDHRRVDIPVEPVRIVTGFSAEAMQNALGGSFAPLVEALGNGSIHGISAVVGCNNPKIKQDSLVVDLIKELISRNILVLVTGCVTTAAGKAGVLLPEAASLAGPALRAWCKGVKLPPVLHMGSCVDCSRIVQFAGQLASLMNTDISDLPFSSSAPEWYSEKAAAIALYMMASGIPSHLGLPPNILGSRYVTEMLTEGFEDSLGASCLIEQDMNRAAEYIYDVMHSKRIRLGMKV